MFECRNLPDLNLCKKGKTIAQRSVTDDKVQKNKERGIWPEFLFPVRGLKVENSKIRYTQGMRG